MTKWRKADASKPIDKPPSIVYKTSDKFDDDEIPL